MDDVLAFYVLLHVAEFFRRVITVGTGELGGAGLAANFRLHASHHLGYVLNKF